MLPAADEHPKVEGEDAELAAQDATRCEDTPDQDERWSITSFLKAHAPLASPRSLAESIPDIALATLHVLILLPSSLLFAFASHIILSRANWIRGGGPKRLAWPISRCRGWTWRDTASVAVVGHLLAAFRHVSRTPFCPSAERLIPMLSHRCFGITHQGWSLGGRQVQLDELPSDVGLTLGSGSSPGQPLTPVLLWKAQASSVHHHQVQTVKPAVDVGGVGSGPATPSERAILLLSGSSYSDRDPVAGLLACNLVNSTGLRTLCVNWRKPSPCSAGDDGAFPTGLNDALAAYIHLVRTLRFKPGNICLAGEGSGAGLAMTLMVWLSALARCPQRSGARGLGRPGKVILWSPWCDLTMRSPTWRENGSFDITSPEEARAARDRYVQLPQQAALPSVGNEQTVASRKRAASMSSSASSSSPLGPQTPHSDTAEPLLRVPSPLSMGESKAYQRRPPPSFTTALKAPSASRVSRAGGRQEASMGSDSGIEVDKQQPSSSRVLNGPSGWASLASQLSRALGQRSTGSASSDDDDEEEEDDSGDDLTSDPCSVLSSSIAALGLAHPVLSPGIPIEDESDGAGAKRARQLVFSLLADADEDKAAPPATSYLLFCGTESVVRGETASLARNLKSSSSRSQEQENGSETSGAAVQLVEALETPTLLNVVPSVFLATAQAKGDEIVQQFVVGDANST